MKRPKLNYPINMDIETFLEKVIAIFEEEHDEIEAGKYNEDNDNVQYIYEAVAEAIYGKDYFKWYNDNI